VDIENRERPVLEEQLLDRARAAFSPHGRAREKAVRLT
jgi:hypothetical protein